MSDIRIAMLQNDSNNPNIGDIFLENGTVRLTKSLAEEVSQRIRISLLMFKGEWFLDDTQGVPWLQNILGIKTSLTVVNQILLNAISQQPGILRVDSFSADPQPGRGLSVSFQLTLADGTILTSSSFAPFIVPVGATIA